jgi:hypothetical protein
MKFILYLSILASLAIYANSQPFGTPFGIPGFSSFQPQAVLAQQQPTTQVADPRLLGLFAQILQALQDINNDLQRLLATAAYSNNNRNGLDPALLALLALSGAGNNDNYNDRSPSVVKIPGSYGGGGGYNSYGRANEKN